jgi:hypothetical protein
MQETQGVREIALQPFASACGCSRTLADGCRYIDQAFAILRGRLRLFADFYETMSLEMSLAAGFCSVSFSEQQASREVSRSQDFVP